MFFHRRTFQVLLMLCLIAKTDASAQAPEAGLPPAAPLNKLTVAFYDFSSRKEGFDINLRHSFKLSTAWVGGYHQNDGFDQVRMGYEYDYRGEWLAAVPSVQSTTHGFVSVSLYAEAGRRLFAIGGMGRTNLKPYWNLGFDPNDYVQFGAGYRDPAGNTVSVYAIHDNRLETGQTNTHFYVRRYLPRKFHSRATLERRAELVLTVDDELKQKDIAEPLGEVYSAQNAFQAKLTTLIDVYKAECDRLHGQSA